MVELSAIDAGDDLALLAGARLSEMVARACPPPLEGSSWCLTVFEPDGDRADAFTAF